MKLVIILNNNPNKNDPSKIVGTREFTRPGLKDILSDGFSEITRDIVFYDNFSAFKEKYSEHLGDYVLNFDFGYNSRFRNMNVPSFCENWGIRYFNPDPYAQVLCQDKYLTKKYAENFGIKTPKGILFFKHTYNKELLQSINCPMIIKPNYESESIGISQKSIVSNSEEANSVIKSLLSTFDGVLVEEYIDGKEIAITLFGNNETDLLMFEVELDIPEIDGVTYKAYTSEIKQHLEINVIKSNHLQETDISHIKQMYFSLSPNKLIRVDGRIKESEFYLIEVNANPGLYPKSVIPKSFAVNEINYTDMFKKLFVAVK